MKAQLIKKKQKERKKEKRKKLRRLRGSTTSPLSPRKIERKISGCERGCRSSKGKSGTARHRAAVEGRDQL